MKKHLPTIFLILIFLIGLSLLLYPIVSDYWNWLHQSRSIVDYDAALKSMSQADYSAYFEAAEEYNRLLRAVDFPLMNYEQVSGYGEMLNVGTNGIMGYVTIEKINVQLPIYHGTSEGVLQTAVGHLEGTSLPTGGESTHCVLSAHRGLPSARLFTDLDKMEIGDEFTLTVLDRELCYQVDQILIVEPREVEALYVTDGEDYCTLLTCTPYGVNSHRMLIRGRRIDSREEAAVIHITSEAVQIEPAVTAPLFAMPVLLGLLVMVMIPKRRRRGGMR